MKEKDETRAKLIIELAKLRQNLVKLEKSETESRKAAQALQESEEKFRSIAECSPNMIFINCKGRVVYANKKCEEILGYKRKEFYSPDFDFFILIAPESKDLIRKSYSRHMKGKELPSYEYTLISKKGERIEAIITTKLIDYGGEKSILGIVTDITERKRMEMELEESEENYRQLAGSILDVFYEMDKDLRYTYWNKASEKVTGIPAKDAIGKSVYELFPTVKGTEAEKIYKEVIRTKKRKTFVTEYKHGKKSFFLEISTYPSSRGLSVFAKDITERKQAEEAIRESQEKFKNLFEGSSEAIFVADVESTRFVDCNKKAEKLTGSSRNELLSMKIGDFNPKEFEKRSKKLSKVLSAGKEARGEVELIRKDGRKVPVEFSVKLTKAGDKTYYQGIVRDITERKLAEEALRESEQRFRSIFENVADGILIADAQNRKFLTGNKMVTKLLGYSLEEIKKLKIKDIHPKEDLPYILEHFKRQLNGDYTQVKNIPVKRKDGSIFYAEISASPVTLDGKTYLMGIFRDTTASKKAEEDLKESEERYRDLVEKADIAIMIDDKDGNFKYFNKKFAELFGYTEKGMKKQSIQTLIHPDDARWVMEFHNARLQGGNTPSRYEFKGVRKDGSTIYLEVDVIELKEGKDIIGTRSYIWDVTARKMAEKQLRQSEEKFRSVVVNSSNAIISADAKGKIQFWNPAAKNIFGFSPEEIIGKPYETILPKRLHPIFKKNFKQIVLWKRLGIIENRAEMIGLRKGGKEFPMEVSLSSWITKEGIFFSSSIRDVTEGKNTTNGLKKEYEALRKSAGVGTKGN